MKSYVHFQQQACQDCFSILCTHPPTGLPRLLFNLMYTSTNRSVKIAFQSYVHFQQQACQDCFSILCTLPPTGLSRLLFKERRLLNIQASDIRLHLLKHNAVFFGKEANRPSLWGYMIDVSGDVCPRKSTVSLLPIIDLTPSYLSYIAFILDQALLLKATEIVNAKGLNMVLVLGGFHLASIMGSIANLGFRTKFYVIYVVHLNRR